MPRYDESNAIHAELALWSVEAHGQMAPHAANIKGNTARARNTARDLVKAPIEKIDALTRQLLAVPTPKIVKGEMGSLFEY